MADEQPDTSYRRFSRVAERSATALVLMVVSSLFAGCAPLFTTNIALLRDRRVSIETPAPQSVVQLPIRFTWRAKRVDGATFALFVDRAPVKPGASLRSLADAEHDSACLVRPTCPEGYWLSARGVYLTKRNHFTIPSIPDRRGNHRGAQDSHEVTIVLLKHGRRVGESAWSRQFYVERSAQ